MSFLFRNNATSTLASGIGTAATSITLQSGDGAKFPSPTGGDTFRVTLADASNNIEICDCTSRSGDVLTVTRAQEGTTAKAYLAGDSVGMRLTREVLEALAQEDDAVLKAVAAIKTAGNLTFNDDVQLDFGTGDDVEAYFDGTQMNVDVNGDAEVHIRDGNNGNADRFVFHIDTGDFDIDGYLDAQGGSPQDGDMLSFNSSNQRFEPISFTSMIAAWPISTVPTGWLYCNGQEVSRTTYARLFALIGTDYGNGNGSTTFNLPDLRGEFLRGQDDGAGNDPDAASRTDRGDGTTGDSVGTKQLDELKSHLHNTTIGKTSSSTGSGGASGAPASGVDTTLTGGNETRPRNVAVRYYIKT